MNSFSNLVKNAGATISKNSPTILTALAVGGVVTTTIFAVKTTPKAYAILQDNRSIINNSDAPIKDIVKLTWKLYIPTACMGAATIACIIGANTINNKRNAALAAVYGLTETAFKEYKNKVVETIGQNKELKIRDDISKDKITNNPPKDTEIIFTGKGEVLCYDSLIGRYFKSDIERIRQTINEINKDFMSDMSMWVSLNDIYYALNLPSVKIGDALGWDLEKGLVDINFSSQLTEKGEPCLVLNFPVEPKMEV